MKKIASLVLASILGGGLALGGYLLITKNKDAVLVNQNKQDPTVFQTKYIPTTTTALDGTAIDFTKAAEETVHAVVHVKNRASPRLSPLEEFVYGGNSRSKEKAVVGSGIWGHYFS